MAVGFGFLVGIFREEGRKQLMVTSIPEGPRQERIPLDTKIGEKLGLENVPTDRSVARGSFPEFPDSKPSPYPGDFFSGN